MDSQNTTENLSQYPDPEESGLSFPWLTHYQPVPAENLSASLEPLIHEGFIPQQETFVGISSSGYSLRSQRSTSIILPNEAVTLPSAVLEDSQDDSDFNESNDEVE